MSRSEKNYKWESWGFAMTNRVEGFDGLTNITTWTYYTSGNGKGQVKTEKRQSGLLTQYTYDNVDRVISETRSGPYMMTETTTYDYTPVDPSDPVLPVDTRPRTVVRKLNNIECERTYYVYSPLTNIVERVGAQGAAYGGTNVLRTVTTFYPVSGRLSETPALASSPPFAMRTVNSTSTIMSFHPTFGFALSPISTNNRPRLSPAKPPATSRSPTSAAKFSKKRPRRSSTEFGILLPETA